jgi:hypothetical protein
VSSSELARLKASLNQFAEATSKQSSGLQGSLRGYDQSAQTILSLIGGSATNKDKQVEQAIRDARKQVEQAAQALARAAQTAKQYASTV